MREAYDTDMGQYAHLIEPMHHMIYMYNYAGTPYKTQNRVRDVLTKLYGSGAGNGGGYLGDEDNGQLSAWYVFSALGFYPARLASTDYTIGAPLHPRATVTLENGRTFTIEAPGVSDTNRYIQSATLNGAAYPKNYLTYAALQAGGTLRFTMGESPSTWGTGPNDIPPSITTGTAVPRPLTDRATGGTLTASSQSAPGGTAENPPDQTAAKLVDDTSKTKWLTLQNTATLECVLPAPAAVKQYTLTTADDAAPRDARDWTLQASTDGATWVILDTRTNIDFAHRGETRAFVVPNSAVYSRYRLQLTANHGATATQLAEWELLA
ncbi:MAG TPA: glycoside hydrolase domain-containing protein [Micromonosporaceae bacterium]|nr:glycoside hydrolase domain-containing protein [Micromonosporaceae bacterium]